MKGERAGLPRLLHRREEGEGEEDKGRLFVISTHSTANNCQSRRQPVMNPTLQHEPVGGGGKAPEDC
jgi:hypothetical protein